MAGPHGEEQTLGQFALVTYIPDPLAGFLNELSLDLSPGCNPRAHVTVLPPRPHHHDLKATVERIVEESRLATSFRIETGEIQIFDVSHVVYLGLTGGFDELQSLYKALNRGPLEFRENFPYHPHITIAQDLGAAESAEVASRARDHWAKYEGPRGFPVSTLSFVQHVAPSIWADVATLPLGQSVPEFTRS